MSANFPVNLKSRATLLLCKDTIMRTQNQIFVSHSSQDTKLIELTTLAFKGRELTPYFARRVMVGENPVNKIIDALDNSLALFALMTPNVVYVADTRDWVVFEIAVARYKKLPIFCWLDKAVADVKAFPKLLENITDYDTFQSFSDEECYRVVASVVEKAYELAGVHAKIQEPTKKELETGLIQMEEAKKIAIDFVQREKKPTNITVNAIEPKGDVWIVSGSAFTKFEGGGGSERWTIEIKGKEILSYRFEPGAWWAIA